MQADFENHGDKFEGKNHGAKYEGGFQADKMSQTDAQITAGLFATTAYTAST